MKSKKLKPRRMVVLGFLSVILAGTVLLKLPVSSSTGESISLVDSFFTSTSAVCVTGLVCIDPGTNFSVFGQVVLAVLIQIGGLGITVIGVTFFLVTHGRLGIGRQRLLKESLNLSSGKGLAGVVKAVLYVTAFFEVTGAVFSCFSFSQYYPMNKAAGISVFHSIAAFNNAGFDILGNYKSLTEHNTDVWLNLVTCGLIICGGLGFHVIYEMVRQRKPRKWSLHTKAAVSTTIFLLAGGTLLLKGTEGASFTWLEAFFQSVSARTAGFASVSIGDMSKAGLMVLIFLMFIGASPGSTGGGIKTTTLFVIFHKMYSTVFNKRCSAFRRGIPEQTVLKALMVFTMALGVIFISTFAVSMLEPEFRFEEILFEIVSGFSTTGLTAGITPYLGGFSKIIIAVTMFAGRLGPMTLATIWLDREIPAAVYSEEDVTIG